MHGWRGKKRALRFSLSYQKHDARIFPDNPHEHFFYRAGTTTPKLFFSRCISCFSLVVSDTFLCVKLLWFRNKDQQVKRRRADQPDETDRLIEVFTLG